MKKFILLFTLACLTLGGSIQASANSPKDWSPYKSSKSKKNKRKPGKGATRHNTAKKAWKASI